MGIRPTLPFFDFFSLSMCPHGFLSLLLSPARLQYPILIPSDVGVTFAHRLAYVGGFVVAVPLQRFAYLRMPCIG